ncbi:unnamed protein product [Clonostachys rhizophaga]|uniref:Uncharacterized protein n=1 Tax=Clonostachys rhizophaga TaxID=160324 RepID=A0A9N9YVG1_9HYPO|nr:unnamed protein product [Clonostachys rhizophaga]
MLVPSPVSGPGGGQALIIQTYTFGEVHLRRNAHQVEALACLIARLPLNIDIQPVANGTLALAQLQPAALAQLRPDPPSITEESPNSTRRDPIDAQFIGLSFSLPVLSACQFPSASPKLNTPRLSDATSSSHPSSFSVRVGAGAGFGSSV